MYQYVKLINQNSQQNNWKLWEEISELYRTRVKWKYHTFTYCCNISLPQRWRGLSPAPPSETCDLKHKETQGLGWRKHNNVALLDDLLIYIKTLFSTLTSSETYLFAWGWPQWWQSSQRRHNRCGKSSHQRTASTPKALHFLKNKRGIKLRKGKSWFPKIIIPQEISA